VLRAWAGTDGIGGRKALSFAAETVERLDVPHETANSEKEADEHHERDKPLIAPGGTVRDDKHAARR